MANSKISALTSGNPAQSGDEIPIARGGANYKITAGSIASLSGNGDVVGPALATDNAVARFDGTTGKLIQNSVITIEDDGSMVIPANSTNAGLRITQTGTGDAILVEDSANPDSSPFVVDGNGIVITGNTAAVSAYGFNNQFQVLSTSNSYQLNAAFRNDAFSPFLTLAHSRNTSIGGHTVLQNGDDTGLLAFAGSDGTQFIRTAQIYSAVDGTPGTNDMPGRLIFSTTADGASSPTERVRINASGLTTVGYSAATGAALSTTVAAKLYSANTTYTDGITAASGTVTHGTIVSFDNPAIAASNASVTYTNASTLYIDGAPSAGSNVTITNPYALYVAAGTVYFGGSANFTWDGTNAQIGATGALRFADTDSSNYVAFKAAGTVASNVTWTLPSADGTNGQALVTNGTGTLSWATASGSPGGSTTQLQYNNAGAFAGATNLVTDGSNLTINAQGDLRFGDSDSSNWVAFQAPATVSSNVTWTLPSADGTSGQFLSTNGTGTLSWATASGGGSNTGSNIYLANTYGAF
jgi:hypothetical protein